MENAFVRYCNMPATVRSYVVLNGDDSYTIMLNCNLTREQNLISYYHEIQHIINGDYEKQYKSDADIIEFYAHQ